MKAKKLIKSVLITSTFLSAGLLATVIENNSNNNLTLKSNGTNKYKSSSVNVDGNFSRVSRDGITEVDNYTYSVGFEEEGSTLTSITLFSSLEADAVPVSTTSNSATGTLELLEPTAITDEDQLFNYVAHIEFTSPTGESYGADLGNQILAVPAYTKGEVNFYGGGGGLTDISVAWNGNSNDDSEIAAVYVAIDGGEKVKYEPSTDEKWTFEYGSFEIPSMQPDTSYSLEVTYDYIDAHGELISVNDAVTFDETTGVYTPASVDYLAIEAAEDDHGEIIIHYDANGNSDNGDSLIVGYKGLIEEEHLNVIDDSGNIVKTQELMVDGHVSGDTSVRGLEHKTNYAVSISITALSAVDGKEYTVTSDPSNYVTTGYDDAEFNKDNTYVSQVYNDDGTRDIEVNYQVDENETKLKDITLYNDGKTMDSNLVPNGVFTFKNVPIDEEFDNWVMVATIEEEKNTDSDIATPFVDAHIITYDGTDLLPLPMEVNISDPIIENDSIEIDWNVKANNSYASKVEIVYTDDNGLEHILNEEDESLNGSYKQEGLTPSTQYNFQVRVLTEDGTIIDSSDKFVITSHKPSNNDVYIFIPIYIIITVAFVTVLIVGSVKVGRKNKWKD